MTNTGQGSGRSPQAGGWFAAVVYLNAVATGFVTMACEILGIRYLSPYFGGSIYTWSALISTVLVALAVGYFAGGQLADRRPSALLLGGLLTAAAAWLAAIPFLAAPLLDGTFDLIADERAGSLAGAVALFFVPMTLLGTYTPFAIRLTLHTPLRSGTVAGRVYGLATVGGTVGVLVTSFQLIPTFGTRAITFGLALLTLGCGLSCLALAAASRPARRNAGGPGRLLLIALAAAPLLLGGAETARAERHGDGAASPAAYDRRVLLELPNGDIEELETEYARIFIRKSGSYLTMSFRLRGGHHLQSIANLEHPEELPAPYTQVLTAAVLYAARTRSLLMLGMGAGTTSRYLWRHIPGLSVQAVELDPGVIALAKKYFGVRAAKGYRIQRGDARVFLKRNPQPHDMILVDAYRSDRVPFHLATREFFRLARARLTEGGVLAMNLTAGTRLAPSVVATLRTVFEQVDTFGAGSQVVAFAYDGERPSRDALRERAAALQARFGFHHSLEHLVDLRMPLPVGPDPPVLTDDFAPADLYRADPAGGGN